MKYEVEITGIDPPFKWEVRVANSTPPRGMNGTTYVYPRGEADSIEDAVRQADEAARDCEHHRKQTGTKERVYLFSVVDDEITIEGAFDGLPVAEPERPRSYQA